MKAFELYKITLEINIICIFRRNKINLLNLSKMEIKDLFTVETTIKVSVVKLDNKKLTSLIFNQLNISSPFDDAFNLKEDVKILGYVNSKVNIKYKDHHIENEKWLIWSRNDRLYKYKLIRLHPFLKMNIETIQFFQFIAIYNSDEIDKIYDDSKGELQYTPISEVIDQDKLNEISEKKIFVKEVYREILKRQIYL